MRVIKPLRLSILQRVLTVRRAHHLSVGILVYFPFEAPEAPLFEVAMWKQIGATLGKDAIFDEGLPKPRGEVLLFGKAFSPGGEPRPAFAPRLQVGPVDKTVYAVGPRRWSLGAPTEPEPITEVPLVWENAFGGPGYAPNPVGVGVSPVEQGGAKVHPLPQLEDPKNLLKSPADRPLPASFGFIDGTWPPRAGKLGTYGKKWLEQEFPGFAHDLDPAYFQVAPEDQRLPGYFEGGEPIALENLHPSLPLINTSVPRLRARGFARQAGASDADPLREIVTRLETVILLPNVARGIAIFRGMLDVATDDAADVGVLLCALEKADAPRSADHYRAVLARRLDKKKGYLQGLRDIDLLPEPDATPRSFAEEPLSDMEGLLAREHLLEARARARAQRELDSMRQSMRVLGLDPDTKLPRAIPPREAPPKHDELAAYVAEAEAEAAQRRGAAVTEAEQILPEGFPPRDEPPGLDGLAAYIERAQEEADKIRGDATAQADKIRADAEASGKSAEEEVRRLCAEHGQDADAVLPKGKPEGGRPPKFRADAELTRLRELAEVGRKAGAPHEDLEAKLADPAFVEGLRLIEQQTLRLYRLGAHQMPPLSALEAQAQADGRAAVERAIAAGEPLAGLDLTGLELRGVKLAKANLREALLESADLAGCDLSGADLSGAVLARANLAGANLAGAILAGANLGEADATGASFEGADLRKAILYKARLSGARLARADLRAAMLLEAAIAGADFGGADLSGVRFLRIDLTGVRFSEAKLAKAAFIQCTAGSGIDFSGAILEGATFLELRAEKLSFRGARAAKMRVVSQSALPEADFTGAIIPWANLRGVDLTGANFEGAVAEGADFSEAILKGARLVSLSAKGARFIRTDLTDADLTGSNLMNTLMLKAKLAGARVERANLFRATLHEAQGDDRTSFSGSHVKRVVFTRKDG